MGSVAERVVRGAPCPVLTMRRRPDGWYRRYRAGDPMKKFEVARLFDLMADSEMTRRMCRALAHPHVEVLAHPTGRVFGARAPVDVDIERVLRTAQRRRSHRQGRDRDAG